MVVIIRLLGLKFHVIMVLKYVYGAGDLAQWQKKKKSRYTAAISAPPPESQHLPKTKIFIFNFTAQILNVVPKLLIIFKPTTNSVKFFQESCLRVPSGLSGYIYSFSSIRLAWIRIKASRRFRLLWRPWGSLELQTIWYQTSLEIKCLIHLIKAGIQQQPHSLCVSIFYTVWVNSQKCIRFWEAQLAPPSKHWFRCKQEREKRNENQRWKEW